MPCPALTRDEQAILAHVRRTGAARPIPDLAAELGLSLATVRMACEHLIGRGLLQASVYAVGVPAPAKGHPASTSTAG